MKSKFPLAVALLLGAVAPAFAHVTLEAKQAPAGSSYKAVFRVPHGCDGAATTALRIQIPEGMIAVKPMPKPGWSIAITTGNYARSYTYYGASVTSGVTEIDFTGGSLPDAYYDEFVLTGTLADSLAVGKRLFFPVVQECGSAADRWIQMPQEGQRTDDLKRPAPALTVTASSSDGD
jgi:uncharacterized protein YcnI